MEQGSKEWLEARLGKVTASRVADVIARTKSGYSASRANYMAELICERLTGAAAERFTSAAMDRGIETEAEARDFYAFGIDVPVTQIGLVPHPKILMAAASPDGLVGEAGLVEIKCPNTATHIETLIEQTIPGRYLTQMMWQMACTGREWCDFVSFDPRLPPDMQLFIRRVPRDPAVIADLEREVVNFLAEIDRKITSLQEAVATLRRAA
jgi:putative phage-type endonuclease